MKNIEQQSQWPPAYQVRMSERSRHVYIKVTPEDGLLVILPTKRRHPKIEQILNEKRAWIEKHLAKLSEERLSKQDVSLPSQLNLLAVNEIWPIETLPGQTKLRLISQAHQSLILMGQVEDLSRCKHVLQAWLKDHAKRHLIPMFSTISQEIGLPFSKVSIRAQKTRWGSCSSAGSVTLNYKLLFLPPEIARHIMIHELCHTVHMNHSKRFWSLVARFDPNWKINSRESRQANKYMPNILE